MPENKVFFYLTCSKWTFPLTSPTTTQTALTILTFFSVFKAYDEPNILIEIIQINCGSTP